MDLLTVLDIRIYIYTSNQGNETRTGTYPTMSSALANTSNRLPRNLSGMEKRGLLKLSKKIPKKRSSAGAAKVPLLTSSSDTSVSLSPFEQAFLALERICEGAPNLKPMNGQRKLERKNCTLPSRIKKNRRAQSEYFIDTHPLSEGFHSFTQHLPVLRSIGFDIPLARELFVQNGDAQLAL